MKASLAVATGDYDHVRDLEGGGVSAAGLELTWLRMPPEEIFHRFTAYRPWEVSEFSLALYVSRLAGGDRSLAAIPVFPSRMFRHAAFFTRPDGPTSLVELAGLRVGVPEWAQTAGVWARGLLAEQYGVDIGSISWVQGGVNMPGRHEKARVTLPAEWSLRVETDRSLGQLLQEDEIDALISARPPSGYASGRIRTVLADPEAAELQYWKETAMLPIMHLMVIRRDVLDAYPWAARSLYRAFDEAKQRSVDRLLDVTATHVPLPWVATAARTARACSAGGDLWPYGVEPNRRELEAFLRYTAHQGITARQLTVEELFEPDLEEILI